MASSIEPDGINCASEKPSGLLRERGFKLGYRPVLDGLRCVAILLVLFFHGARGKMPGGWVGVEIFFVLSGFLITTLLLLEIQKRGRIDLKKFYIRRALRLFPALYSMLFLAFLTSFFVVENRDTFLGEIMAAGLHVWNYGPELGFWEFGAPTRISHTWSLSTEEQFYLAWPFFLSLLVALRSRAWLSVGVLAALYLALPGYQVIILGCMLAIVFPSSMPKKMATPVAVLATLSTLFLLYVAFFGPEKTFLVKLFCGLTRSVLIYFLIFFQEVWPLVYSLIVFRSMSGGYHMVSTSGTCR